MTTDEMKRLLISVTEKFGGSKGGRYIFSHEEFGASPKECLGDELKRRFDVLVDMDQHHTAPKGTSMATFGLFECIGGYIDNKETNTLFHYSPLRASMTAAVVQQHVTGATNKVHFFVSGEWGRDASGKYEQKPKEEYTNQFLASALARLHSLGVEYEFHCYSECRERGRRYQGTAWLDAQGKLFDQGIPIQSSTPPKVETSSPFVTAANELRENPHRPGPKPVRGQAREQNISRGLER